MKKIAIDIKNLDKSKVGIDNNLALFLQNFKIIKQINTSKKIMDILRLLVDSEYDLDHIKCYLDKENKIYITNSLYHQLKDNPHWKLTNHLYSNYAYTYYTIIEK